MWKKTYDWLEERLGLKALYENLLDRPEPRGNWWNTLGSASLFLFVIQGLTGIFLTVYYTPSPDHAYDSIQYIMNGVAFGWLIRGIHHWGASLMVLVVFIHMLRVFATASFKYPRELTWLIGIGLLLLTLGMASRATCCPGTRWLIGPPRSAHRSQGRCPSWASSSSKPCAAGPT